MTIFNKKSLIIAIIAVFLCFNVPLVKATGDYSFFVESDAYITIDDGNFNSYIDYNKSFSFDFWAKIGACGYADVWFGNRDSANGYVGFNITTDPSCHVYFDLVNNISGNRLATYNSTFTMGLNNWHHFVISYDGTAAPSGTNLWVDGDDKGAFSNVEVNGLTASTISSVNFNLGADGNPFYHGSGIILDEFRVWSRELIQDDVDLLYNSGDGTCLSGAANLLAEYSFDEGTGTLINDSSGNNYDGSMVNSGSFQAGVMSCPVCGADPNCGLCGDETSCNDHYCYWYGGACNNDAQSVCAFYFPMFGPVLGCGFLGGGGVVTLA